MRHSLLHKKLKSSLILFVTAVVLVSALFASAVNIHQAHAASADGSTTSVHKKILFQTIIHCLYDEYDGTTGSNGDYVGYVSKPKSETKINNGGHGGWIHSGVYIESVADNAIDDGITDCGHILWDHFDKILNEIGITKEELYCRSDAQDVDSSYRILKPKSGSMCLDAVNEDKKMYLKDRADFVAAMEDLFKDVVFKGSVPGGDLYTFTDLEKYYLFLDAYTKFCTAGGPYFNNSMSHQVYVKNPSTGRLELAGYSIKSGRENSRVRLLHMSKGGTYNIEDKQVFGREYTCAQVADLVLGNKDSAEVKALADLLNAEAKKYCYEQYHKKLDEIRTWLDNNRTTLDSTQINDVNIFINNHVVADSYRTDPDDVNGIKCNVDTLATEWEEWKSNHNLSDAITLDADIDDPYTTISTESDDDTNQATCHNAAHSLGWILCPILEFAADASDWAYTEVIEPRLKTDPGLFKTDGINNGTYRAWKIFRDVANILFVILMLFVVFSQVTGYGIDNYGIKKSLPKLVIAAILVNVSFYVCQGLIDLSNIGGSGLYDTLAGIAEEIEVPTSTFVQTGAASITFGVLALVGTAAIGTWAAGSAFWSGIASAFFALVPVIISAAVAILMLFLLLAMRQAVVVVLVAFSPIAFVAYTLPNTKKLFERWSEILRGMLLLYPIAAVLMAGGRLASRIIFSAGGGDNLGMLLTAMVAEIIPLFLIPSLTRSAYRATGALGATINRLSTRAVAGTRRAVANSRGYQRTNERLQNLRAKQRVERHGRLGGRRLQRYNEAAAAVEAEANGTGTATRRQRLTARLGRDRAAALKMAAEQAAQSEGRKDAWAAANEEAVATGAREKARIDTTQQIVGIADFADANIQNATIRRLDEERNNKNQQTLQWNNDNYVEGKHIANEYARGQDEQETMLWRNESYVSGQRVQAENARQNKVADVNRWNNPDYVTGKTAEANLARQGEERRVNLFTNQDYITSRERQQEAVISGEMTKMYSDQFSHMSAKDIQIELGNSMDKSSTVDNRAERFEAASRALISMGLSDKVREEMANHSGDLHDMIIAKDSAGNMTEDAMRIRNSVTSVAGSSGDFVLREYAKHLGKFSDDGKALSYNDWMKGGATTGSKTADGEDEYVKDMSLAASIQAKGMGGLDKDSILEAAASGALKGASAKEVSRFAASTTDPALVTSLTNAINGWTDSKGSHDGFTDDRKEAILKATNGSNFVNMSENVRVQIAGADEWKKQLGSTLASDPQLRGKLTAEEQSRYVGTPTPPTPTPTPTPPTNPTDTINPRDFGSDGAM